MSEKKRSGHSRAIHRAIMENDLDTPDSLHHADHVAELPQSGERTRGVANARAVLVYLVAMVACTAQLPPASAAPAVARDIDPSGSPAGLASDFGSLWSGSATRAPSLGSICTARVRRRTGTVPTSRLRARSGLGERYAVAPRRAG